MKANISLSLQPNLSHISFTYTPFPPGGVGTPLSHLQMPAVTPSTPGLPASPGSSLTHLADLLVQPLRTAICGPGKEVNLLSTCPVLGALGAPCPFIPALTL